MTNGDSTFGQSIHENQPFYPNGLGNRPFGACLHRTPDTVLASFGDQLFPVPIREIHVLLPVVGKNIVPSVAIVVTDTVPDTGVWLGRHLRG